MYRSRSPEDGVLYRIVRDPFETFRAQAAGVRDGEGLPRFVEQAFQDVLRCGWLAGGFARFRCAQCGLDRLVAFSCKGRTLCTSCGGRRMAERAAHLVDHVFPDVPVRQWVLSLPYRLRYLLAWDHDLCRAVAAILAHAIFRMLRERARDAGLEAGRGGGVVVIQRFGGALNLNVHFHALVLDGVFAPTGDGTLRFHPPRRLTTLDVAEVLATIEPLIDLLLRQGRQFVAQFGSLLCDELENIERGCECADYQNEGGPRSSVAMVSKLRNRAVVAVAVKPHHAVIVRMRVLRITLSNLHSWRIRGSRQLRRNQGSRRSCGT